MGLDESWIRLCLFLHLGEESSELDSMDDSLDGNDAGGEHDGDLGEWHLRVMMGVVLGLFDVCQVHQTTWTWCPYSWFPSGKTQIWPCWADGLERKCLWAVSSLFSLDGLERRSRHDIWASNELYSFCRLCCCGLGSCRIIHIPIFQSLYQLST